VKIIGTRISKLLSPLFNIQGGDRKNVAVVVSIEIERVAQEQYCVCAVYVRLRYRKKRKRLKYLRCERVTKRP